MVQKGAPMLAY